MTDGREGREVATKPECQQWFFLVKTQSLKIRREMSIWLKLLIE